MKKKVMFATLILSVGLLSCSEKNEVKEVEVGGDGYVEVTIGTDSQDPGLKSLVGFGGATSWNVGDKVMIIDVDGENTVQAFSYAAETPKSSAAFKGKLKAGQGSKIYKAYHAATGSACTLKNARYLALERKDITVTETDGVLTSSIFGSYCPMVAIPLEFNAESGNSKAFQFHHLTSLIEARVNFRNGTDNKYLNKVVDKVVFEVKDIKGDAFNTTIEFDLATLNTSSTVLNLLGAVVEPGAGKTSSMSTTINLKQRTIKELIDESKSGAYAIPIIALPTKTSFPYTATVSFYKGADLELRLKGSSDATGLNPSGLNILNFDHNKVDYVK